MSRSSRHKQARRALERQLEYQEHKARSVAGREAEIIAAMQRSSKRVRDLLTSYKSLEGRVIEVGSGAHGLIFYFDAPGGIGIDPLAVEYARLFPAWQKRVSTVAAFGEHLPFVEGSFDVVLCDNVVDHAESPCGIVKELVRILRPGGLLYFTVNVHHPIYSAAARAHASWKAAGLPFEIGPFADHTVHLTPSAARQMFAHLPLEVLSEREGIQEAKDRARKLPARHFGDRLKRVFYKNAVFEIVARKEPGRS